MTAVRVKSRKTGGKEKSIPQRQFKAWAYNRCKYWDTPSMQCGAVEKTWWTSQGPENRMRYHHMVYPPVAFVQPLSPY